MKTFYVSLTHDLIGCYLSFEAESESAVRSYLESEYIDKKTGVWKLPWCSVYESAPTRHVVAIIKSNAGPIHESDWQSSIVSE